MGNVIIPERSKLFNLTAIGINTENIESLTSYVSRLTQAHNVSVGVFFSKIVIPKTSSNKLISNEGHSIGSKSSAFNNYHETAKELSQIIGLLTTNNQLELLTLIGYEKILSSYELGSKKRWCPVCLLNWKLTNNILYHKLLWAFEVVEICLEHKCSLVSNCFECGTPQYLLHAKGIEGYCNKCGAFLGKNSIGRISNKDGYFDWQKWVTENVSSLLTLNKYERTIVTNNSDEFSIQVSFFLNSLSEGIGITKKDLAILGNFDSSNFCDWQRGEFSPSLYSLLKLCYLSQIRLIDFYTNEYKISHSIKMLPLYVMNRKSPRTLKKYENEELREILKRIIKDKNAPPPSLSSVAKKLGYKKPETIRAKFPKETDTIIDNYRKYSKELTQKKYDELYENIRVQVVIFLEQGIYPSMTKISRALNNPSLFRNYRYKDMLKQIFNELGVIQKPRGKS